MKAFGLIALLVSVAIVGLMIAGTFIVTKGGPTSAVQSGIKSVDEAKQVKARIDAQQQEINAALQTK